MTPSNHQNLNLFVKHLDAWEVGLHDIDMVILQSDDNAIIPVDEKNPPVKKLLEYLNERKKG